MSHLKIALADDFSFDKTFNLEKPFDTIFFSYSISMIPPWQESIQNALQNLKKRKVFLHRRFLRSERFARVVSQNSANLAQAISR